MVLFPETSLTSYYLPYAVALPPDDVAQALHETAQDARRAGLWVIAGTIRPTADRCLNVAHVISPAGEIVHEYAKVQMAGRDEKG